MMLRLVFDTLLIMTKQIAHSSFVFQNYILRSVLWCQYREEWVLLLVSLDKATNGWNAGHNSIFNNIAELDNTGLGDSMEGNNSI